VDELTREFLLESGEGLDRMEQALGQLQQGASTPESIGEIFRAVHTMKGATGFLGLPRLEKLTHAGESLLSLVRDGKRAVSPAVMSGMLKLLDRLRKILQILEQTGAEGQLIPGDDDTLMIAWLQQLAAGQESELATIQPATVAATTPAGEISANKPGAIEGTLRVEVETLNRLMNLVGELVQTRNQILQTGRDGESFTRMGQRLDSVTADLRETVMQARMQPVGQLFQRFPRMVRELEQTCGKCVRLEFSGSETGLDKSLLEALKDPLSHSIRNAIDHGIETGVERIKKGKALEGVVRLRAFQEGGFVVVEVSDDGAGISITRVLEHAVQRALITPERARTISEADALELLFSAGFSTRDEVTLVSGRGVGMDVVRSNIEGVGGAVELTSVAGEGTTLRMRVPLTLAIIPALIARCAGQSFAIPQASLVEMLLVLKREEPDTIEYIGNARMFRLRGRLAPLLSLGDILGVASNLSSGFYIAVLESKGQRFGLMIDDLAEPQEIVVKPLSTVLRSLELYSGASALSDGSLALILDIAGLARAGGLSEAAERAKAASLATPSTPKSAPEKSESMLVFEDHTGERKVLPMACLERIESVARTSIEFMMGRPLLQYRGGLLELEDPGGLFSRTTKSSDPKQRLVLICKRNNGQRVGIVVLNVLDIAETESVAQPTNSASSPASRLALVRSRLATVLDGFDNLPIGRAA